MRRRRPVECQNRVTERLFNWLDQRNDPGPSGQVVTELRSIRAIIAGCRTNEHAGRWQGDHHDGVPVFALTHNS